MQNCEIQHACIGHCPLAAANAKNHKPRPRDFFTPASVDIIIIITSTSDLQPSTPTANQLPGQLVSTEIRTMHKNKFKFIIALNDSAW